MTSAGVPLTARCAGWLLRGTYPLLGAVPGQVSALGAGPEPEQRRIPTRHGQVRCLIYRPPPTTRPPPVYVHLHGGAFIVRTPQQDHHVCRYLATHAGTVVVSVDYDTAPQVRYPVAEQQAYDVAERVAGQVAGQDSWDGTRIAVGGLSAGAKLAINICQQARDTGSFTPVALISGYAATDLTLAPDERSSPKRHPAVAPWLLDLMYRTYFPDAESRREPLASPALDPDLRGFPPTLLITAELDAMTAENERFADRLAADGVSVTRRQFAGVDHGFTHDTPTETAAAALRAMAEHLTANQERS